MLSMLLVKRPRGKRPVEVPKKAKRTQCTWHHLILPLKEKNIIVFTDVEIPNEEVSNPIDVESGETLFILDPQGCYDHEDIKVNPKHPRAQFYQLLMDSYEQYPSGDHFKQTIIDPYLDAPSDDEQDLSNEEMGCSP